MRPFKEPREAGGRSGAWGLGEQQGPSWQEEGSGGTGAFAVEGPATEGRQA